MPRNSEIEPKRSMRIKKRTHPWSNRLRPKKQRHDARTPREKGIRFNACDTLTPETHSAPNRTRDDPRDPLWNFASLQRIINQILRKKRCKPIQRKMSPHPSVISHIDSKIKTRKTKTAVRNKENKRVESAERRIHRSPQFSIVSRSLVYPSSSFRRSQRNASPRTNPRE